jgi:hypothetical protein
MFGSLILITLILVIFMWKILVPDIMLQPSGARILYIILSLTLVPIVSILGWFGAKMTFPH